ncbi:MAG: hypothetical protein FD137_632 [Spirochaetes bacterium]|nr:MAG: hypothetical protein FD137_632 [Spirochaetota bacterium]
MKKIGMIAVFAVLATTIAFSATLSVQGNVARVLTVSLGAIGTETGSVALDVNNLGTQVEALNAANLIVVSSHKMWTISFASTNKGFLKAGTSSTDLRYDVKVDTTSLGITSGNSLSAYTQLTDSATKTIIATTEGKTQTTGKVLPISILIPSYAHYLDTLGLSATTAYTDTITITVTANN